MNRNILSASRPCFEPLDGLGLNLVVCGEHPYNRLGRSNSRMYLFLSHQVQESKGVSDIIWLCVLKAEKDGGDVVFLNFDKTLLQARDYLIAEFKVLTGACETV